MSEHDMIKITSQDELCPCLLQGQKQYLTVETNESFFFPKCVFGVALVVAVIGLPEVVYPQPHPYPIRVDFFYEMVLLAFE